MKKHLYSFFSKFGGTIAALAIVVSTMTANTTCLWITNQPEEPDAVKALKKN